MPLPQRRGILVVPEKKMKGTIVIQLAPLGKDICPPLRSRNNRRLNLAVTMAQYLCPHGTDRDISGGLPC